MNFQIVAIGDFADVKGGKRMPKGVPFSEAPTPFPYLRVSDFKNGGVDRENLKYVDQENREKIKRYTISKDDIYITIAGTLGSVGMIPPDLDGAQLTENAARISIRDHDEVSKEYLFYALCSDRVQAQFSLEKGIGGGVPKLALFRIEQVTVPLPPLSVQRDVANFLGEWDQAIETLQSLIDAKTVRMRGLMQQLLTGRKRLPGFVGEWQPQSIGQLLNEVKRDVEWDDDHLYRLVSVRRRSGGFFLREPLFGRDIKTKTMKTTEAGDFVISKMQVVHGAMAITPPSFDGTHVSGSYITLVPKSSEELHMPFFDYLSRTPRLYHLALISSYGVVIEKMTFSLKDFFKQEVLMPPTRDEQVAIAEVLRAAEKEINLHRQQLKAIREQKRGLMQKLLTGEVRVNP